MNERVKYIKNRKREENCCVRERLKRKDTDLLPGKGNRRKERT